MDGEMDETRRCDARCGCECGRVCALPRRAVRRALAAAAAAAARAPGTPHRTAPHDDRRHFASAEAKRCSTHSDAPCEPAHHARTMRTP